MARVVNITGIILIFLYCRFMECHVIFTSRTNSIKCDSSSFRHLKLEHSFEIIDFKIQSLRGVQALNFRKLFSEITVEPKVPPDKPTFWLGLEARDPLAPAWRPRPFPAKN